jgi:L-lactate dehydrogenase complex protein LldE
LKKDDFNASFKAKAAYHDSCAALRECGIKPEPRQLLSKVNGLQLLEIKDNETCCGFGGTFSMKFEGISVAMADQKIQHALDAGADHIISTDMSCLMHMEGCIKKQGLPITALHIADVLASGW